MNNLAVIMSNDNNIDIEKAIIAIGNSKFKDVFIQWYDKQWEFDQEKQLELSRKYNLNIVFAHLGYQGINNLWLDNEEGENLVYRYYKDLDDCSKNNINTVVMHLASGFADAVPECSEIGLDRIKKIVKHAEEVNVKIAFENHKTCKHLMYVLNNIKSDNVGLCFDSGHYNCYTFDNFDNELFYNRIFAVHLHDNDGKSDQHIMPLDGNLNFEYIMNRLKENNYNGPITFESVYNDHYTDLTIDEFYDKLYSVGEQLKSLIK